MTARDLEPDFLTRDYGDVAGEARACRRDCALFDFSFLSRARVSGDGALDALARLQPRPMGDLAPGRIRYALRLDAAGAVVADLTIWNLGEGAYEIMSGRRADVIDLAALAPRKTRVDDLSDATCVYALQGPGALHAIADFTDAARLRELSYFGHDQIRVAGYGCRIGRLGYTGEKGFELVVSRRDGAALWQCLAERARPAGFAAADCLRIEAGFILFINECVLAPTPAELGLARFAFRTGRAPRMHLACFTADSAFEPVLWRPSPEGLRPPVPGTITVTSACRGVVSDTCLGLGFVHRGDASPGRRLRDPCGHFTRVELVSLPFYDCTKQRARAPWPVHPQR